MPKAYHRRIESHIRASYRIAGFSSPEQIVWFDGANAGALFHPDAECIEPAIRRKLPPSASGESKLSGRFEPVIIEAIRREANGRSWVRWCSTASSLWWPYETLAIVCEPPISLSTDARQLPHAEEGPCVQWPNGWGAFAWHGTPIPPAWMTHKEALTPATVFAQANAELRRAGCEICGWNNLLKTLKAKLIDRDPDPQIGELIEVRLPRIGRSRFLRVLCGTGRLFALPVPPGMRTALEANAWTYQIPPDLMRRKEFRT